MRSSLLFFIIVFGILAGGCGAQNPNLHKQKLASDAVIQGYPCAKGYAWFYSGGALRQCAVSRDTSFGEAQVPQGSIIVVTPEGRPHHVFLSREWTVAGYRGMGPGWLPVAEGNITAFYPSGRLQSIYLVADQAIEGVPCRSGGWGIFTDPVHGGNAVVFYEDGRLRSCKLTRDFRGRRRGDRIELNR